MWNIEKQLWWREKGKGQLSAASQSFCPEQVENTLEFCTEDMNVGREEGRAWVTRARRNIPFRTPCCLIFYLNNFMLFVCVYSHVYTYVSECGYSHVYIPMYVVMCVYSHMCTHVYKYVVFMCANVCIHVCIFICVSTQYSYMCECRTHMCLFMCECVCIFMCVIVCVFMCVTV